MRYLVKSLKNKIRVFFRKNKVRVFFRQRYLKRTAPLITKEKLKEDIRKLLSAGDHIFLHSSLKSIGYVEGGAKTVIEAITDVLTPEGTLAVPTYSMKGTMYTTCLDQGYIFDPKSSATEIGLIPSVFLTLPNIQRSVHPTHSVSAIGKEATFLTEAHHHAKSTFGKDSPWDRLMILNGKIFCIGIKMGRNTFSHVLEDEMLDNFPLPVRMKETYFLKCKYWDDSIIEVPVNPLDPKYAKIRLDHPDRQDLRDYMWNKFNKAGILKIDKVGQAIAWSANINNYYEYLKRLMKEGITIYSTPDELKKSVI